MRVTTVVLIFLLFLNLSSAAFVNSGAAEDMGIEPSAGGDDAVEKANSTASQLEPSGGFGATLFGLFVSVGQWFDTLVSTVFAAPHMFQNLGVPAWITNFVFGPMYIVATIDIAYILIGRRL